MSQLLPYLGLPILCLLTFRDPLVGLAGYYALAIVRPQDVYWWSLGGMQLSASLGLTVLAVWLGGLVLGRHRSPLRSPLMILLVTIILLKAMSTLVASGSTAAWEHVTAVAKMVLVALMTVSLVDSRTRLRVMVLVIAASLAYLGIWGNWEWYVRGVGGGTYGELAGPGWEIGASLGDRNLFGALLVLGVPFCIYGGLMQSRLWLRFALWASVPFLVNAVFLTFSRTAFLSIVSASILSVLRLKNPRLALAFVLAGSLVFLRLMGTEVITRVATVVDYEDDSSATGRLESWKAGLAMVADHPLFGVGPENFGRFAHQYNPQAKEGRIAHNEFIQTAAESGVLAGLALVAVVLLAWAALRRVRCVTAARSDLRGEYLTAALLEAALLAWFVSALFLSLHLFEAFYLLIALVAALDRVVGELVEKVPGTAPVTDTPGPWWQREPKTMTRPA